MGVWEKVWVPDRVELVVGENEWGDGVKVWLWVPVPLRVSVTVSEVLGVTVRLTLRREAVWLNDTEAEGCALPVVVPVWLPVPVREPVRLGVRVQDGVQLRVKLEVPVICGVPVRVGDSEQVPVVDGVLDTEAVSHQLRDTLRDRVSEGVPEAEKVRPLRVALEREGLSVAVAEWLKLWEGGVHDSVHVVVARAVGVELTLGVRLRDSVPDADVVLVG